jgi:hypothetical protein
MPTARDTTSIAALRLNILPFEEGVYQYSVERNRERRKTLVPSSEG